MQPRIISVSELKELYKKGVRDFSNIKIVGAELSGSDFSGAVFRNSVLDWTRFVSCKLVGTDFSNSEITWCNFSDANLKNARFSKSKVYWCLFSNSYFDDTSFRNVDLRNSAFFDTNNGAADFTGATIIRMITSLAEVTEEDLSLAFDDFKKRGFSITRELISKHVANKLLKEKESLKTIYDMTMGRTTEGRIEYLAHTEDSGISTYGRSSGVYVDTKEYNPQTEPKTIDKGQRKGKPYK